MCIHHTHENFRIRASETKIQNLELKRKLPLVVAGVKPHRSGRVPAVARPQQLNCMWVRDLVAVTHQDEVILFCLCQSSDQSIALVVLTVEGPVRGRRQIVDDDMLDLW